MQQVRKCSKRERVAAADETTKNSVARTPHTNFLSRRSCRYFSLACLRSSGSSFLLSSSSCCCLRRACTEQQRRGRGRET